MTPTVPCTQRSKPMCYCTYFNDSWSCPENGHYLDKKYSFGFFDRPPANWTNSSRRGRRLEKYLGWSIAEDAIRTVVVFTMLITRVYAVCRPETWCEGNSRSSKSQTVSNIVRSKSTSKELDLQWKIAMGFLVFTFEHWLVVLIMLQQCDKPTGGGLQQANAAFKIMFMCTTSKIQDKYQHCLCPCNHMESIRTSVLRHAYIPSNQHQTIWSVLQVQRHVTPACGFSMLLSQFY